MRKASLVIFYVVALLSVNAYICRDLFFAEYTGHTNSIQGLWISMAGLAGSKQRGEGIRRDDAGCHRPTPATYSGIQSTRASRSGSGTSPGVAGVRCA